MESFVVIACVTKDTGAVCPEDGLDNWNANLFSGHLIQPGSHHGRR